MSASRRRSIALSRSASELLCSAAVISWPETDRSNHSRRQDRSRRAEGHAVCLSHAAARAGAGCGAPCASRAACRKGRICCRCSSRCWPVFRKRTAFCWKRKSTPVSASFATIIRKRFTPSCASFSARRFTSSRTSAAMAQKLSAQLSADRKIMLGVQLYDLISQAGLKQEQVVAFYSFMSQLGHGGAGDRHRLSTERLGRFRSVDLSARRVAARIAFLRTERHRPTWC